jgi:hypothetical protein
MTMEQAPQSVDEAGPVAAAPEAQAELPPGEPEVGQITQPGDLTQSSEPVTQSGVAPPEAPAGPVPVEAAAPKSQYTPEQIAKMQQDAAQYEQVQVRASLQQRAETYKKQLEENGFLPEHADHAANAYVQSEHDRINLMQQADQFAQHVQGKQVAAEHFARQYKLGMDDLATLRQSETPQAMEGVAKKMSADRERDDELTKYRQARVPAQSFDNSQGNPQVAAGEGGWLDRYNGGDRSASAVAAARRAAGLG